MGRQNNYKQMNRYLEKTTFGYQNNASCPYVFCNKNVHHSQLLVGKDVELHLQEYHQRMEELPITTQEDNKCNLEKFTIPLGYLTYATKEYEYKVAYCKEGSIVTKISARMLLQRNEDHWWWGPWLFNFDGISFYLTLYRNDDPFISPNGYYKHQHDDRRICFLIRGNCEKYNASRYSYRVQIYDPTKSDETSISCTETSKFFVGEVQSLEKENYDEERRIASSQNIHHQRDEFLNHVSTGHIVHYWQSTLRYRAFKDGYIRYKIIIYRKEGTNNTRPHQ